MTLDRRLRDEVRALPDAELARLVILARDLLERRGVTLEAAGREAAGREAAGREAAAPGVTYRQERVRCGKANCGRCPHGPYWYAYWREGGKVRSRYLGTTDPRPGADASTATR